MADNQKERIMRILGVSAEEANEIMATDKEIDRGKKTFDFDLTPEQQKAAKQYTKTGTRTVYNFDTKNRTRKENATKGGLIAEFAKFLLEGSEYKPTAVNITNKERQIAFTIGNDDFELTLVQKRKKKT